MASTKTGPGPANWLRALAWTIGAGAALFLVAAATLCIAGLQDDRRSSDVAVVLGNHVSRDGRPSPRLAARLDEAVRVWRADLVRAVVVSGGVDDDGTDEAAAMRLYLIGQGIPDAVVFTDPGGINTWETARNTTAMMERRGWRSVMVISQYFHIARTTLAFRRFGVADLRSAHPDYFEWRDLYSIARETLGYPAYWLSSQAPLPGPTG